MKCRTTGFGRAMPRPFVACQLVVKAGCAISAPPGAQPSRIRAENGHGNRSFASSCFRAPCACVVHTLFLLPKRRLRRRQPCDGHPERAATDVIQPDLVAELYSVRVAAVL